MKNVGRYVNIWKTCEDNTTTIQLEEHNIYPKKVSELHNALFDKSMKRCIHIMHLVKQDYACKLDSNIYNNFSYACQCIVFKTWLCWRSNWN